MAELRFSVTMVGLDVGPTGGMERHLYELIVGLLGRGHEVTVISRTCTIVHPNLRWCAVKGPARPFSLVFPWYYIAASRILAKNRRPGGIVHTTGGLVLNSADVSTVHIVHRAINARKDFVRSSRTTRAYRLNQWISSRWSLGAERWAWRPGVTRHLVAVSQGVAAEVKELYPRTSVRVIPNGVDLERFKPDPAVREATRKDLGCRAEHLLALFVGGEWERKGLAAAIAGIAMAPGWRLLVAGDGDEARYVQQAERLGVRTSVKFLGGIGETAPLYAAADAFLLPSAYESFSLATYEAAASGLPLLASDVSGVRDILVPGQNGWFVDRDPSKIGQYLRQLGADPDLRASAGSASRRSVGGYTWDSMVTEYLALYESIIDRRVAEGPATGYRRAQSR